MDKKDRERYCAQAVLSGQQASPSTPSRAPAHASTDSKRTTMAPTLHAPQTLANFCVPRTLHALSKLEHLPRNDPKTQESSVASLDAEDCIIQDTSTLVPSLPYNNCRTSTHLNVNPLASEQPHQNLFPPTLASQLFTPNQNNAPSNPQLPLNHQRPHKGQLYPNHKHVNTHLKPEKCTEQNCHWAFTTPKDLRRHAITVHGGGEDRVVCVVEGCGKVFTRKDNLERHVRAVHG